jgi:hypothetical protein
MEHQMQWRLPLIAAIAVLFDMSMSLAAAAAGRGDEPMPPHIDFATIAADQLRLGMTELDVIGIMGEPTKVTDYVAGGIDKRRLEYQGSIPGKVTLSAGRTTGVALDVLRMEKGNLPSFSQKARPGMASAAVRQALGAPSEICHHGFFGIKLDQWVYARPGEEEASLFLVDDRVVAKAGGRRVPQDIFEIRLPARSGPAKTTALAGPSIGMTIDDVRKLFGGVKLRVDYVLNGQSASRMIIETRNKGSFVAFNFVDDRLIAFEDLGALPDEVFRAF